MYEGHSRPQRYVSLVTIGPRCLTQPYTTLIRREDHDRVDFFKALKGVPLFLRDVGLCCGILYKNGSFDSVCLLHIVWSRLTADLTFLAMISVARIFAGITENLIFFFNRDNSASLKPVPIGTMGIDIHQRLRSLWYKW